MSGDGRGQLNPLEVINDNDSSGNYKNLESFSSNLFSYGGNSAGPAARTTATRAASPPRSI